MSYLKAIGNKYFRSEYIWGVIILIVLKWLGVLNETIILTLIAAMFTSKGLTDFKKQETKKTSENPDKNVIYSIPGNYQTKDEIKKDFKNNSGEYNSIGYGTKNEVKKDFKNISGV